MKHICAKYLFLILTLSTQVAWGQTPDSTARQTDPAKSRTVVSDRLDEIEDRERGPSLKKIMETADKAFGKQNFFAAKTYYGFVLKVDSLKVEALKGYGESAFEIAALDSAEATFQRLVDHGISPSPEYFPKMRLAEVKYRKGLYGDALELFSEIAAQPSGSAALGTAKKEAAARIKDCVWAMDSTKHRLDILVEGSFVILDTLNVNKLDFAEYASVPDGDSLFFSAYRFDFKKDRANPKRNTIKLLTASGLDGQLGPGDSMAVNRLDESKFNEMKRQHMAHYSYSKSGNVMYYTLGDYVRDSATIRFDLYRCKKQSDGAWGKPEKLNAVNMPGFTNTEPSIGTLPGDKHETLFFVSDRPGGKGGRDIWFSRVIGDSLSPAFPLTAVNTKGDDVTPFYHEPSSNLYFSTDGTDTLLRTIGGFDVYKVKYAAGGKWGKPMHMGTPINSYANDVFFTLDKESNKAYFSNNLRGNSNKSEEGCCYDIYSAEFIRPILRAIGHHKITRAVLPFTRITLYEKGSNGELVAVANPQPDASSSYSFEVKLDKEYVLIADKMDFTSDTLAFKTPDEVWPKEIVKRLYLMPHLKLVASVWDCETGEPIYGATANFINLTNAAKSRTDLLPSNSNIQVYTIDFEQQYQVIMSKYGYQRPDTSRIVSTKGLVDSDTLFVELRLERPDPFANFDTIIFYFDNDYPKRTKYNEVLVDYGSSPYLVEMRDALLKNPKDPKYQDSVLIDYQKTFAAYAIRNRDVFIPEYIKGLKGQKRIDDSLLVHNFFENEAVANFRRFLDFTETLKTVLDQGATVTIDIQGFASPLSNPDYNLHLTNRRIASVYNMFVIFDDGAFLYKPDPANPGEFVGYYKPDNTGQLKFSRKPNGENDSKYKGKEAEDTKNFRTSVYDVRASRERRVEISGIKIQRTRCYTPPSPSY
ncbi:MAG: hypothetical protein ACKVU0_18845 [Saprospiraceae bacterium]